MFKRWTCVSILAAVTVCGCATSYQKHGLTGGYSETKINDSAYIVSFNGNGYASKDRVWYFWIYRCAELTSEQGYKLFSLRQSRASAVEPREGNFVPAVYNPDERGGLMKVKGGAPMYIYTPGTTVTTWNSSAAVLMYPQPLPQEVLWAFDSQTVLDRLKPYVTSNGSAPAPSRNDLLKLAFVAHERVDVSSRIKVSATESFPGPSGAAGSVTSAGSATGSVKATSSVTAPAGTAASATAGASGSVSAGAAPSVLQPRSGSSIQSGIDFSQMLMLHAAYRDHATRTHDIVGGQVVLGFVISPNGPVREARVVSTTFTDRQFVALVLEVIRRIDFGPMSAAETRVAELPISFSPQLQ